MSKQVQLSGVQKVAVLMMDLMAADPEGRLAADVMAHFTEDEATQISAEVRRMQRATPEVVDAVMDEMAAIVDTGRTPLRGGEDMARNLLVGAFGNEAADDVMDRAEGVLAGRAFEFMDEMDPAQIRALISDETTQIMAVVLSNLNPKISAEVMGGLDLDVRHNVAMRIAKMGSLNADAVQTTADMIKSRVIHVSTARTQAQVGGVDSLVAIVNRADSSTEKGVLEFLEADDPELGAEVRSKMFTFDDLIRLDNRAMQAVVRSVKVDVLAKALRNAKPAIDELVRNNMSARNIESLDEEIGANQRLKSADVEEARGEVVRMVRQLEAEGQLDLSAKEDDYV